MNTCMLLPTLGIAFMLALGCSPKTSTNAVNIQIVRDSFDAMDKQDYKRCRELWPAGDTTHKPFKVVGSPDQNREELINFLQTYWKAFPDTKHVINELVADENFVVAKVTCQGTHQGDFEGLPASRKAISYVGVHIIRFDKGKVQEWWAMDDNLGMMQQLGMQLSPPAQQPALAKGK